MVYNRGDTISDGCKTNSLTFRLNLRIIINGKKKLDCCNGEFARRTATNESKLYYDKSKATLAAKCHLNHTITTALLLTPKIIPMITIPIIQIMDLSCHVCLSLADKSLYVVQDIYQMNYPRTRCEIKSGPIQKLIDGLSLVEVNKRNISNTIIMLNSISF